MKTLLVAALLLVSAGVAKSDSVWQYQGNSAGDPLTAANPCQCSLSGSVTFDASWNAVLWDFTDGTHTLTQANSTGNFNRFERGMDTLPPFAEWFVSIVGADGWHFWSQYYGSGFEATDLSFSGNTGFLGVQGNKGVWTDPPVGTPEPSSLLLLGAGLVAALFLTQHRLAGIKAIASGERA